MALEHLAPLARERIALLRGRRVGVVGLGREGVDLVGFLCRCGAEVTVSDRAAPEALAEPLAALAGLPVRYTLGAQRADDLAHCSEIFVSPGVPRESSVVAQAATAGIRISSATSLFLELCPGPIAGITGSSGKTTTTALTGRILEHAGIPAVVGGNIGIPMLGRLAEITAMTWCVLELSSFQLADLEASPRVAAVLNITPNHLDRHPDMDDYIRAKSNIVRFQRPEDIAVLNADDPIASDLPHASSTLEFSIQRPVERGAWLAHEELRLWTLADPFLHRAELRLRGLHNVANALAAAAVGHAVGCAPEPIAEAIRSFEPVPHRLEAVATFDGITYINDSIGTSPERSAAALRSFVEPVVLIAGGRDKHLPMEDWAQLIVARACAVVLVGEAAPLIKCALESAGFSAPLAMANSFRETVPLARSLAKPGDVVLLSPGCTSFDEFRDYEARGHAFRRAVRALAAESDE